MTDKIGERLDEIIGFELSNGTKNREKITTELCSQFLESLSEEIEKNGEDVEEDEGANEQPFEDKLNLIGKIQQYLTNAKMEKEFNRRNLKCNAVLHLDSCVTVSDWEKRDVPVIASFGFPRKVPNRLLARMRSNKILGIINEELERMFPDHEVTEVDHNKAASVPYLLCTIDDVTVIIKISIKPFCSPQFLAKDVINQYASIDNRFNTLANYLHKFLKGKAVKKSDQRKIKSVVPKLCSLKMMFIHCFKHYGLLPSNSNSLEEKMASLSVTKKYSINLGTLLFLFLDYYLDVISLEKEYLEIGTGESLIKLDIGLTNKNILSISDIFDDHVPGERVNDTVMLKKIFKAMYLAVLKYLNNRTGILLNDLKTIPFRPKHIQL
ncbi:PAP-associated domain-containing protein [Caenorhabditis elegans]|uniref:PAP-associated domain-containing protein n=1 Tax=Caenorhabditis elegans TaxID=6239 RepID=Q17780_CAEEL|nr:PAP-associated domain-containing protein [Caenorhabditis elegans]CCD63533.1 PAP-associated domain-containing protein [Caenorhabditis elegans]|eukprot:NP_495547.2 Uncharacterized protein CELE_C07D10.5 [Caenorhabditis elegans]